jgi:flagellar biogenesis protein FliO
MKSSYIAQVTSPEQTSAIQPKQTECLMGSLLLMLPILLLVGFLAHRKHRLFRLQQQIAVLEKIWQLDSSERRS